MHLRRLALASAAALTLFGAASSSHAGSGWQEWHQTGNDVFVTVDKAGAAHVEHHVRYRVVAGKMQSFDLTGVDLAAAIAPEVSVVTEDGTKLGAHAEGISAKAAKDVPEVDPTSQVVRVTVDDPKGLKRGTYAFVVAYDVDGWKTKHLTKDGSMVRVTFKQPPSPEGRDGARAVFRLPQGPTEPRIAVSDDGSGEGEGTALVTLRRKPEGDEIELVRAHVSRGEVVTWAVRADAKAFAGEPSANLPPSGASRATSTIPDRRRAAGLVLVALVVALGLGALAGRKARAFRVEVQRLGATPRPLLPLPGWARPPVVAVSFGAGLAVAALHSPLGGAFLLVLCMLTLVELRPTRKALRVRGPGEWRPLPRKIVDATRRERLLPWLDATHPRGALTLGLLVLAFALAGRAAERLYPGLSVLAPLSTVALFPLFFSGLSAQLPSATLGRALDVLGPLARRVESTKKLATRLYGRLPQGEARWDEARLRTLPRDAVPGIRSLEVGVAEQRTLTGFLPSPEVLVRVFDGSSAHLRLESTRDESLAQRAALPGREADEKVLRFTAPSGDVRDVEALLLTLVDELKERRTGRTRAKRPTGPERRAARKNVRETAEPLPV